MRYTHVVTVIAWAFLALWTSVATAQEAPTLTMVTESHIKPGMLSQFEEARKESLAFRAEHDFAFTELAPCRMEAYSEPSPSWAKAGKT